jgi:A/G-specific adenine glycosylase
MPALAQLTARHLPAFRRALLAWYEQNRRDLPWRNTRDPYRIWVSEIMLQQTRVVAVLEHYARFLDRFSNVQELARAPESGVLAAWSGLGYYRRARNLHAAAKVIVRQRRGEFPQKAEQWRELPGIGRYTAAAIASIALGEPVAVLDGNVERVLRRLLGLEGAAADLWQGAEQLLDRVRPGDYNQAMMELGAVLCLPAHPQCSQCPIHAFCRTRGHGHSQDLKSRHQMKREVFYSLVWRDGSVMLVQRGKRERLMPGMWELPQVNSGDSKQKHLFSIKHTITVTNYTVHVVNVRSGASGTWVRISRLGRLPLTGLTRKILRGAEIIQ